MLSAEVSAHFGMFQSRKLRAVVPAGCLLLFVCSALGQPLNDNFENRQSLNGLPVLVSADNRGASLEPGEPLHGDASGGRSMWWTWISPVTSTIVISVDSVHFTPAFAVYTGSALTNLGRVVEGQVSFGKQFTFTAQSGVAYHIAIDTANSFAHGSYTWSLSRVTSPENDDFAMSQIITDFPVTVSGTNISATREPLEPLHDGQGDHSVWWTWVAPENGQIGVLFHDVPPHYSKPRYALYVGDSLFALELVPRRPDTLNPALFAVQHGRRYYLAVDGAYPGLYLSFLFTLFDARSPANDSFEGRQPLSGLPVAHTATNLFADREPGEPDHGFNSVWWSWTAPVSGDIGVALVSDLRTVRVYTGESLSTLQPVSGLAVSSVATFPATAGNTYHIAVANNSMGGYTAPYAAPFDLEIGRMPANDSFANRTLIEGFPASATGNNRLATVDPPGPIPLVNFYGHSLWWEWVSPLTGRIALQVESPVSKVVAVYSGSDLSQAVEVFNSRSGLTTFFDVSAGQHLQIFIGSGNVLESGDLSFRLLPPAQNDSFSAAFGIPSSGGMVVGSTAVSSHEPGEAQYSWGGREGSVWYSWTPDQSGPVWVRTQGTYFNAEAYVFTGDSLTNLKAVAPGGGDVSFEAIAGTTYSIAITGYSGTGPFKLTLFAQTPSNDLFESRIVLNGSSTTTGGDNLLATVQEGEPDGAPFFPPAQTLWYSWTAPDNGILELATSGSGFGTTMDVFTGDALLDLVRVASGDMRYGGPLRFAAKAGTTYAIRVSNAQSPGGSFNLKLQLLTVPTNDSFASRTVIRESSATVEGWTFGASREPGEPKHGRQSLGRSIWWSWTAPASGSVRVGTLSSEFPMLVGVYTGSSLRSLKKVTNNWDAAFSSNWEQYYGPILSFAAEAGVTYQIALDGLLDRYARPQQPAKGRVRLFVDFTALRFRLPSSGIVFQSPVDVSIDLFGPRAEFDGLVHDVELYRRSPFEIDRLVGQMQGPPFTSVLSNAAPGNWQVVARATNAAGVLRESAPICFVVRPSNDAFSNRVALSGYHVVAEGAAEAATWERREVRLRSPNATGSVWWSWTAPSSGQVHLLADYTDTVQVFSGGAFGQLRKVAQAAHGELRVFPASAGVTYQIAGVESVPYLDLADGLVQFTLDLRSIALTSPKAETSFTEQELIPLSISTTEASNRLVRVDYLANGLPIADSAVPPFHAVWSNTLAGANELRAVATTVSGQSVTSSPVTVLVRPANDKFSNAFPLVGTSITILATNRLGTLERGEPDFSQYDSVGSIWWRWTAPASGRIIIPKPGPVPLSLNWNPNLSPRIDVFQGVTVTNLARVVDTNVTSSPQLPFDLTVRVTAGETYYIRARSPNTFEFRLLFVPPPANDDFARSQLLQGEDITFETTTFAATVEPGEPPHTSTPGAPSVWFTWTAPDNGWVTLGQQFYGILAAYTGSSFSDLVPVPSERTNNHEVGFSVRRGQSYHLAFGDIAEALRGIPCFLKFARPPVNDDFGNALAVYLPEPRPLHNHFGTILAATSETGEPSHGTNASGRSVWWTWIPYASRPAYISAGPQGFLSLVAVYTGESVTNLTLIAQGIGSVSFDVERDVPYRIAIDGIDGGHGAYTLLVRLNLFPRSADAGVASRSATAPTVSLQREPPGTHSTSNAIRLVVRGDVGQSVVLQSSPNLIDWRDIATGRLSEGRYDHVEAMEGAGDCRFYRASVVPE